MTERKATILVVDDDPAFAYAVWRHLEANNYLVISAKGSTEAVAMMEKHKFDLVVADIRFSRNEPNGLELARTIKSRTPEVPVILITAFPELVQTQFQLPAVKVFYKPVELPLLTRAIGRAIGAAKTGSFSRAR